MQLAYNARNTQRAIGAKLSSAITKRFGKLTAVDRVSFKVHEGEICGYEGNPRLHFLAGSAFALMAILRLVRFNLETDSEVKEQHASFFGLPSPAAAGARASVGCRSSKICCGLSS